MTPATSGADPRNGETSKLRQQFEVSNQNTAPIFSPQATDQVKIIFPSLKFLPGRVLGILLTGRRYTSKDAWIELCHSRVSDSVWKLRRLGWPVQIDEVVVETNDAGRPATIGVYYLDAEAIAFFGECGRQYAAAAARLEAERRCS